MKSRAVTTVLPRQQQLISAECTQQSRTVVPTFVMQSLAASPRAVPAARSAARRPLRCCASATPAQITPRRALLTVVALPLLATLAPGVRAEGNSTQFSTGPNGLLYSDTVAGTGVLRCLTCRHAYVLS